MMTRNCWAILASLLLLGLCGCRHDAAQAETGKEAEGADEAAVTVPVEPAQRRAIAQVVQGLGSCEALLNATATLAPAVEGRVLEILAKQGDAVKAGQPVVQLDARVAEANFSEKKLTREGLEASLRLLKALPRLEEQKALQLAIDDAKVGVEKAESIIQRLQPLLQQKEIPEQQMFEARLALNQARVQQEKAEMALTIAMLGARAEAIEEAQVRITTAAATETQAKVQRDLHTIRAPIDGILDAITCRLGQSLAMGTPIGEIVDAQQLNALVWLPVRDARLVRVGQAAQVCSSDSPATRKVPGGEANKQMDSFSGQVAYVGQVVDPQTGNVPVRVLVDNPQGRLRLGQMITVAITVDEKPNLLAVPVAAISDLGEGPLLSVVRNGKSVLLYPQLGRKDQQWVEVVGINLKPGEPVVVDGNYNLPEGTKIREQREQGGDENAPAEKPAEAKP
jgi:membrane fusion protein (multidrug efflux system)